jgi:hypothetical protein
MIAVVFQARRPTAARPTLEQASACIVANSGKVEGFISVERFENLAGPGKDTVGAAVAR